MIQASTLLRITEAFPKCSFGISASELIIYDANAEVLGKIDFQTPGVFIYNGYSESDKAYQHLIRLGIQVEIKEADMEEAMKILYDN